MTILVIQHGKFYDPPDTANCRNCRCIFSYGEEDKRDKVIGGDYDVYKAVTCPECGWDFEVEE